jgi:hypothetical protein
MTAFVKGTEITIYPKRDSGSPISSLTQVIEKLELQEIFGVRCIVDRGSEGRYIAIPISQIAEINWDKK